MLQVYLCWGSLEMRLEAGMYAPGDLFRGACPPQHKNVTFTRQVGVSVTFCIGEEIRGRDRVYHVRLSMPYFIEQVHQGKREAPTCKFWHSVGKNLQSIAK